MADGKDKKGDGPEKPRMEEEPILARLKSGATQVPGGLTSFVGLLGRSPKEGSWQLFLTLDMSVYVEIRGDDIVQSEQLPPDKSPFGSLGGTRVFVKKDAEVTTTRTFSRTRSAATAGDEFDLDIRLGRRAGSPVSLICAFSELATTCQGCPPLGGPADPATATCESCGSCDSCFNTCGVCGETREATCQTCHTNCGQATCRTCQTCHTNCGQATCQTCDTNCGQATCRTCPGETCRACGTITNC